MKRLSESEVYIMQVIWRKKGATSFDILDNVKIDKKISPNTVRTLLKRLVNKKAIYVAEKNGRVYTYKSLIDKKQYIKMETDYFIENIYKNNVRHFLSNLIKDGLLIEDDLKEVKKILEKKK